MFLFFLFLGLSAFFAMLALHPFVTYPLSLRLLGRACRVPLNSAPAAVPKTYAICVCAYNEEAVMRQKAENLLALQKILPGLQVYVYVDASSDRTAEILEGYRGQFHLHIANQRHGKTYGMNLLLREVTAEIVIFSDANVMLDVATIPRLAQYFADPKVGCVCGHLIYQNAVDTQTSTNGSLYWKLEEKIKQLESETGSLMGADGSIFAIRRALHTPPPADLIDDMYVSFSILCQGYRIVRAEDVIATEQSVTVAREEFRRKVRIACQAFNVHRVLWSRLRQLPALDLYKYISHKLLRWFTILWLGLSVLFFVAALGAAGYGWLAAVLLILGGFGITAGALFNLPVVTQIVDILYAFVGTGLGVWKSLRGERFQTWAPAASIRKREGGST